MLGPLVTLALVVGPSPGGELQLTWEAPAECPDAARVRARVEQTLGRPLGEGPAALEVQGRFVDDPAPGLSLTTRTEDGERTRQLDGADCEALTEMAVFAIAVAIDPTAVARAADEPEPEPGPEPEPAPAPEPEPTAPPDPAPASPPAAPAPTPRVRVGLGVAAGATIGLLPRIGPTLTATTAVILRRARVALHYDHHFEQTRDLLGARAVHVRAWTLGLRGCWVPRAKDVVEFPVCGGAQAGPMRGRPTGDVAAGQTARVPLVAADASLGVGWAPVRWLAIGLNLEAIVPVTRPAFSFEDAGLAYRAGSVAGRAIAGVEVRLP